MSKASTTVEGDLLARFAQASLAWVAREIALNLRIVQLERENAALKIELHGIHLTNRLSMPTTCYRNPRTATTAGVQLGPWRPGKGRNQR